MKKSKYNAENNWGLRRVWKIKPTNRVHNRCGKKYTRKGYRVDRGE